MEILSNNDDDDDDGGSGGGGKRRIEINDEKENVHIHGENNNSSSSNNNNIDDLSYMMKQELMQSSLMNDDDTTKTITTTTTTKILSRSRDDIVKTISKMVVRQKLQKLRHLVLQNVIALDYLEHAIFDPYLLPLFDPQEVQYNGGIANVKRWKISCYLEVMEGGVPCTNPNLKLLEIFRPLLNTSDDLFLVWYKQQHACNSNSKDKNNKQEGKEKKRNRILCCKRLMTFVTRYTPNPGENSLLKHVDGAGKVDGSVVVALPSEKDKPFEGYGGGLTFWDGRKIEEEPVATTTTAAQNNDNNNNNNQKRAVFRPPSRRPREIHYDTRAGDIAFIDKAVWHQADPITKGTRWALVIFYKVDYV